MTKVLVTGIGLLSSLGNLSETWTNIINLKCGISPQKLFSELGFFPLGLIKKTPILINDLTQIILKNTLINANLTPPLNDCAVVIGSSRGCQIQWENLAREFITKKSFPSNINCLELFPSKPSQIVASFLQTNAPVFAPMAACATSILAIAKGYELIKQGYCHQVIVGGVESAITPLTLAGFDQLGALTKNECKPFDIDRNGFALAEGGAMLLLESEEVALKRNAFIYGEIAGFALSCDATHITQPEITGKTAILTIKKCLEKSNLKLSEINYISLHGTGTKLNDEREAKIIESLDLQNIPISSNKGAIGHTLGASGAISTALSLMSLKEQKLLPNVGLNTSDFDLNIITKSENYLLKNILIFSFGFGGQNAVLAIKKYT